MIETNFCHLPFVDGLSSLEGPGATASVVGGISSTAKKAILSISEGIARSLSTFKCLSGLAGGISFWGSERYSNVGRRACFRHLLQTDPPRPF